MIKEVIVAGLAAAVVGFIIISEILEVVFGITLIQ